MCVECHEPLDVAQSPEAFSERAYIRGLIAQGQTARADRDQMVTAYGDGVLAKPPAIGFNLTVYILPPALVDPAWPRWLHAAALAPAHPPGRAPRAAGRPPPALSPADARRLDEDLARHA